MNKTPITVALERQIPEYIRGEYEIFVNFIKAYYEFLDQTQQRNLEDIRSIEDTLDEFVIRFKKELSFLFPTNTLENERFILQRIREFYKTRGSKESYQFLFKILFNKDSDIFYPSTQILRASDGKWVQEKSVFVKSESGNLFNLSGKIINIRTANKEIHVFCPRVVYYRDNIYEVFINRAYVQDISISDVVLSADGADYGSILPCPSKYTITTEGAGFEVGQLYYLKTESGDGSLIKITKIGTGGSVKKVQVISFGLDYKSTFYAKLSNKQAVALPYYHPITSKSGSIPTPAYPDRTSGFIDYGYINTQDYFYFDANYTPSVAHNQNVFYADGTYVGEIIASFYTLDSIENSVDKDAAEIKIELGSVAIYPGYYSASDGFISDESYIQDGKYYQLFSYVIKVEQQIDSYLDIVKQLLHPAGLELYAEYTIKNDYLVSASPLLAFIRRQFLEQEYVTDDEATNSVYKNVVSDDSIAFAFHTFITDIKDVQKLIQIGTAPVTTFTYYDDDKVIPDTDSTASTAVFRYNDVSQQKSDSVDQPLDGITNKNVVQLKQDTQVADSESEIRYWDISSITNGTFYQTTNASHSSSSDIKDVSPVYADTETPTDAGTRYFDFSSIVDGTFYQTASASHSSANDIKDVSPVYADTETPTESLDRTVIYDRSIVPLVSLDPAIPSDDISSKQPSLLKTDTSDAIGGEWSWNGVQYIFINPEIRIGMGYSRAPDITLIGTVTANSTVVNLTFGTTEGISNGRVLTKVSGTGAFGTGTTRVGSILSTTSFDMNIAASVTGSITFTLVGETPELAQLISSPTDSFPDGSTAGLVKFAFSGASWTDVTGSPLDSYADIRTYFRSPSDTPTPLDTFPDGSTAGVVKLSFSGASWTDVTGSPLDSYSSVRTYDRTFAELPIPTDQTALIDNTKSTSDTLNSPTDSFPDGSTAGLVKFAFSGGSWADVTASPTDSYASVKTYNRSADDAINNISTSGTLYYNAYNQDTSDPLTSYSYEAEVYSEHITRAIS